MNFLSTCGVLLGIFLAQNTHVFAMQRALTTRQPTMCYEDAVRVCDLWEPIVIACKCIDLQRKEVNDFFPVHYGIGVQIYLECLFETRPDLLALTCANFVEQETDIARMLIAWYFPGQRKRAVCAHTFKHMLEQISEHRETEFAYFQQQVHRQRAALKQ